MKSIIPFDLKDFFEDFDDEWLLPVLRRSDVISPRMDLYETENDLVAELSLPKVDPNNIEISVEDQTLRVRAETEEEKEEEKKGYWRKEIRKGSFERVVSLPKPVKEDKVEAVYKNGVLKITMPKLETKKKEKKVKVKVEK